MTPVPDILTIGHSTHSWEQFAALLRGAEVTAVADVRSRPYSRHAPQFNRADLTDRLRESAISYVFLGRELGGRPASPALYTAGIADYEKMAGTDAFKDGIERLIKGSGRFRIALLWSEKDPLDCHRGLLVSRALENSGVRVAHILADGVIVTHTRLEERLLTMTGKGQDELFVSRNDRLAAAYWERGRRIAFAEPKDEPHLNASVA
jgi:uncharacterized protein (DUF488 family)